MILCSLPHAQYTSYHDEIDAAIRRTLDSGWYVLGKEVVAFEEEFAAYLGARHAVGVNSGTDALHVALKGLGIGPGDEVITVSHTAVATVAAIVAAGAAPVLVDIEPDHFTIDAHRIEAAVTPRTKAVIPVHLYGQPCNMDAVLEVARRRGLKVIEDCAQATGADYRGRKVGSFGDIGCFSFYPTKNLGALGDGGMVVTDDDALAEQLRAVREYGWDDERVSQTTGFNSRLDEMQAAILGAKLPRLDADNARRREIADGYDAALAGSGLALPHRRGDATHVFHLYVVRTDRRDTLLARLKERNIAAGVHYPVPVHQQPGYAGHVRVADDLRESERAAAEVVSLPIYPELTAEERERVVAALHEALKP